MSEAVVIAIDGPGGSGKSTVAKAFAERAGIPYLDTGAMYRAVAHAVLEADVDPSDAAAVAAIAVATNIELEGGIVRVNGADATTAIRGQAVTSVVSAVSANPAVRNLLRERQRKWVGEHGGGVLEGRDIGTVVFPDAALKIYLTARPEVRAARRADEAGQDFEAVLADIGRRDAADSSREHAPLAEAADAVNVDTSDLTISEVVKEIMALLEALD
jgi:cytidylate kinase